MSEQPIPPSIWARIVAFMMAGRYGRIEIDVKAGRVVGCNIHETIRPDECEPGIITLRESA